MKRSPEVALGVLLAAATLLILATPASARDASLRGTRINVLVGPPVQTLSASEPSFVNHGWVSNLKPFEEGWTTLSAEEKREFLDDAVWRFELFVDGVQIALERSFHVEFNPFCDCISVGKRHIVQFEANRFAPGTYVFEGRWYGDNDDDDVSELEIVREVTVIFA